MHGLCVTGKNHGSVLHPVPRLALHPKPHLEHDPTLHMTHDPALRAHWRWWLVHW
jgi:hypothetical protein